MRVLQALIPCIVLVSCSSGSTGPVSGTLNVTLSSTQQDDGGVLFTISGGPVASVEAVSGTVRTAQIDGNTLRVIITGDLSSGPIARVGIADLSQASMYSVALNQVAARSSYEPRDLAGYSISLAP